MNKYNKLFKSTQKRKTSCKIFIYWDGKMTSLVELSNKYNINYSTILSRYKRGIYFKELITPPKNNIKIKAS